ncbi:phosphatidylinositol-3,5-bisphosphate 5-phosphatase [Physocladia obscura]|uniref:Phosphatidylinositol-3,5-bisphosphate 5-phosphatase n=1 Tax=Physocladia obscura TaxID=109957 RepID=A0AAD5XDR2_9FUNG|nr:phosphatidylinositol-3,5-bisphosphate 5-phosphatase [Physocladia obscura]
MSFRQLRGSTPLIWRSSPPDEILQPVVINISESRDIASKNALRLHLTNLIERYGEPISLLSLLSRGEKRGSLAAQYENLANAFCEVFNSIVPQIGSKKISLFEVGEADLLKSTDLQMKLLIETLRKEWMRQGYFSHILGFLENAEHFQSVVESQQQGILRVNGIDCIDMTNVVQYKVAEQILGEMLKRCEISEKMPNLQKNKVKNLWVQNGRALAQMHTGVPRVLYEEKIIPNWIEFLFGSYIWRFIVRLGRLYMGTFRDSRRQEAFECMLGKIKHTSEDAINLQKRVLSLATNQKSGLAFFMLVKRFFSPTHVNSISNLLLGAVWLLGQAFVRKIVGEEAWSTSTLPRIGSKLDTTIIMEPTETRKVSGLNAQITEMRQKAMKPLLEKAGTTEQNIRSNSGRRLTIS